VRFQWLAALFLLVNAVALAVYLVAIDLPLWWWGVVAGILGLVVLGAQWRRCVPSFLSSSRSRSPRPPTQA
jgi:hypothetical protein